MSLIRRAKDPECRPVYEAAERWRDACLRDGRSLFDPERQVWTRAVAVELHRRFVEGADLGSRGFAEKLQDQLDGAGQSEHLLMAELMFVHLLPLTSVRAEKKLENIDLIGSWAPEPFMVPEDLRATLKPGIFNGGAGFNTRRHELIGFLIGFTQRWAALEAAKRAQLVEDPWRFKDFLYELPSDGVASQQNALLLMLFPETFEDISARDHKLRIAAAFPELVGDSKDVDRQILAIRAAKTAEFGEDFSWYDDEIRKHWDKEAPAAGKRREPASVEDTLAEIFPDADDRVAFATIAAAAIRTADAVNPLSWSLTHRSSSLRLNVGANRTLFVQPGQFGLAVSAGGESLGDELRALDATDEGGYSFPSDVRYAKLDAARSIESLEALQGRMLRAVRDTAVRKTPFWRAHSYEAVEALSRLVDDQLPQPPDRERSDLADRAWIIRMVRDGHSEVPGAIERSDVRIYWSVDVPAGSSVDVIKRALFEGTPEMSPHAAGNQAGSIHRFIARMGVGDLVLLPDGSDLYIGTVAGDAEYDREVKEWSREVLWANAGDPVDRQDVSDGLYSRLRTLLTITEISDFAEELQALIDGIVETPPDPKKLILRPIDDDLAKEWMLDRAWLQEILDLLAKKQQLIFFGPPGTGKTFIAERLAKHLTGDAGNYTLVQFHPSYSYEDFVEGFRPQVAPDGTLTYELTPGPLKQLAEAARANPKEPYLLLIDEINRGNLAKIFGELYYLLEYRERSLVLQYGTGQADEFSLPENLYVIGTMNTADRSIAMVDAAIRRRFYFVEFSPVLPPIDGLLATWLRKNRYDAQPAALLAELNRRLDDADYAIGPSYLITDEVTSQQGLERIWRYSIMPLLNEHFYDRPGEAARFALSELQRAIAGAASEEALAADAAESGGIEDAGDDH